MRDYPPRINNLPASRVPSPGCWPDDPGSSSLSFALEVIGAAGVLFAILAIYAVVLSQ